MFTDVMRENRIYTRKGNRLIASEWVNGKVVSAEARCNPTDVWNTEKGIGLADERLDLKIIDAEMLRVQKKMMELQNALAELEMQQLGLAFIRSATVVSIRFSEME